MLVALLPDAASLERDRCQKTWRDQLCNPKTISARLRERVFGRFVYIEDLWTSR
jgi:hypothetical protein